MGMKKTRAKVREKLHDTRELEGLGRDEEDWFCAHAQILWGRSWTGKVVIKDVDISFDAYFCGLRLFKKRFCEYRHLAV